MCSTRPLLVLSLALWAASGVSSASASERHDVQVVDDAYDDGDDDPAVTEVTAGDRVAWYWAAENDDQHTVTAVDGSFDSDRPCGDDAAACRSPGYVFSHTFTEPGTYRYRCEVHLTMLGTVEVRPAAAGEGSSSAPPSSDPTTSESASPSRSPTAEDRSSTPGGESPEPRSSPTATAQPSPSPGAPPTSTTRRSAPTRRFPGLESGERAGGGAPPVEVAPLAEPSMSFEPFPSAPTPGTPPESPPAVEIPTTRRGLGRGALTGIAAVGVLVSGGSVARVILRS